MAFIMATGVGFLLFAKALNYAPSLTAVTLALAAGWGTVAWFLGRGIGILMIFQGRFTRLKKALLKNSVRKRKN
ncbi:hypothetical protein M4D55_10400 [Metabacillus idriensis]|uniref:Uncharacterized protein n=1 Tax=Metabacillus idriensis TaxID=324768 RepID=A0A6I2MH64_9BACI|nr:hypothetical protein [Metabacillus idriensis]MCM3596184.1 hypothetical protein [Metabacillus idriensis]MRX56467.1 hypothetical protein [Metabacillus idriensis]